MKKYVFSEKNIQEAIFCLLQIYFIRFVKRTLEVLLKVDRAVWDTRMDTAWTDFNN